MALQAYIDDSYDTGAEGFFVLAGVLSSEERWSSFSSEWERLLPYGTLDSSNSYHFKMVEMASNEERLERIPAFYKTIEDHAKMFLSVRFKNGDFERALKRVEVPGYSTRIRNIDNKYIFAFKALMAAFHHYAKSRISMLNADRVDFIFDDQAEQRMILESWDAYLRNVPESLQSRYGSTPRFGNDKTLLPLQAADFWAWWVRKWSAEGEDERIATGDFGWFKSARPCAVMDNAYSEDDIVGALAEVIIEIIPPGYAVWDTKQGNDLRAVVTRHKLRLDSEQ